jgi:hypothetical protein
VNLKYFHLDHRGPGAARNFGAEKAEFSIVFFCGDDTFPDKNLLEKHVARHQEKRGRAVLGFALWDESGEVTDFIRWLAPEGPQFHYDTIKDPSDAGFDHFYTCNISLEKKGWRRKNSMSSLIALLKISNWGCGLKKKG